MTRFSVKLCIFSYPNVLCAQMNYLVEVFLSTHYFYYKFIGKNNVNSRIKEPPFQKPWICLSLKGRSRVSGKGVLMYRGSLC